MRIFKIDKVKVTDLILIVLPILILFGDLFSLAIFSYLDEIAELISICWIVYSVINNRNLESFIVLIFIFIIGFTGNVISKYYVSFKNIILDYILILKFPICFIALNDFIKYKKVNINNISKIFSFISLLFSYFVFIGCFYKFIMVGGNQVGFLSTGYAGTAGLYSFAFSLLIYSNKKINKTLKIVTIILNFVTAAFLCQNSASTVYFITFFGIDFYSKYIKAKVKGNYLIYIGLVLILVLSVNLFGYKIQAYFIKDDTAPRKLFFTNSFYLANMYKGFGVGFGLFGGSVAANNYSPVYYALGWNNIWTVSEESHYLIDSFFPTIIGELGYFGTLLYCALIYCCMHKIKGNKKLVIMFIVIMLGGLTANFINSGIGLIICLAINILHYNDFKRINCICNERIKSQQLVCTLQKII